MFGDDDFFTVLVKAAVSLISGVAGAFLAMAIMRALGLW